MPLKENVARNTDTILSPTRLKLPSKSINTALLAPTSSSIPSRSLPVHSDIDRSQILLSPQFKHLKYKKDSTCTSSFSNLLPTNQIQIGIKTNNVSSLASFVNPNTIKAKPTTPHVVPQPPALLSSKNKRAKWDTKAFINLFTNRGYLKMPWRMLKCTKESIRS